MDLSIFIILVSATFQFFSEYCNWNQTTVKLIIFLFILIMTLPNILFMIIDWWQSPHSKSALLVLNTFQPILRGETYRLFRWLKGIGVNLACDDLNHLPITKFSSNTEFYMTSECLKNASVAYHILWNTLDEAAPEWPLGRCFFGETKCTFFFAYYTNSILEVHQLKNSKKLKKVRLECVNHRALLDHPFFESSRTNCASYSVDDARALVLISRLMRICQTEMPILIRMEQKNEWFYFRAGSTLDHLNGDLVLIDSQGAHIAVGSPQYSITNLLFSICDRVCRWSL